MGFLSLTDDLMFTHENRTESYDWFMLHILCNW
jgi:hypothetical protein